jgi:hypothetical protein
MSYQPNTYHIFCQGTQTVEKSPFCYFISYCKAIPSCNVSKAYNVSNSPTTVKYKFGIQVPRGIRNAMSLDKKNQNNLWQQAIQTEAD